ncbi:hypothetical protein [Secundilactobacillus odoratitofui]|uniref:hypothetical protein n=1 Tax=Secundilactobacillus odoratitofui TaxID=480930 RepID=UPI0006D10A4B|nr:hypothetical protein [Secundilactobacillus odoratitofui]
MKQRFVTRTALMMVSGALLSATMPILPSHFDTTMTAQAATVIPYSTFTADFTALQTAVNMAGHKVQSEIGASFYADLKAEPEDAYSNYLGSFSDAIETFRNDVYDDYDYDEDGDMYLTTDFAPDWAALSSLYQQFKDRFSKAEQTQLASMYAAVVNEDDPDTITDNAYDFAQELSDAVVAWGADVTLAQPQSTDSQVTTTKTTTKTGSSTTNTNTKTVTTTAKKGTITQLKAHRTASKKSVKVTGTVKASKSANYARIKTYKAIVTLN